ncbi:NAD-dependent epimerase/dehydratase family protein [Rickettsiales endosymbiont of Stachyamoeba lipophora]|uniref:NAD-dependent epimerase/dehydratase family protein n=1 Tax=Rickettsiales endosymbiont of Stachyamoeba lipophora TaxID=2486578 RepID=UPI000F64E5F8|nr:NAD(P)-dependent oxidoreductase [Rickettsiales endosymbiont of Stachyamoeba lipophora]AZL15488.1 NAD(P)-dependent oxidoreductase [Rickettsiales endosymbiont of Stachyamoeba lipophora]
MSKQKILICGATGFIGRNAVNYFCNKPEYEVHAVHFNRPTYDVPNVTWHHADLRNPADIERVVNGVDIIIQAAATTSGAKDIVTKPYIHVTDNAVMNSYLFRTAFEKKIKHVVFFSCTVMYHSSETLLKEEDFDANKPMHPRYFGVGNTKVYIEKMAEFFAGIGETKYTVIRHSNIYGPYDKFDFERSHVFGATVSKVMLAEDKISVWGTGEEERDLLHASDLNRFIELALLKQPEKFRLYNCGLGVATSIKDLVHKIIKHSSKTLKIEHDLSQPTIKTSLALDCSLAQGELGWQPQINLDDGIAHTLSWWKENINPQTLKPKENINELL